MISKSVFAEPGGSKTQLINKPGKLALTFAWNTKTNAKQYKVQVSRLPGFSLDTGSSARGFAGTAGNVLVDGARPTAKTDDLSSILGRIPAASVERIEVIRGGAPGIDMQGQNVVANVIRRKDGADQTVLTASNIETGSVTPSVSGSM